LTKIERLVGDLVTLVQSAPQTTFGIVDPQLLSTRVAEIQADWRAMVSAAEARQAELAFLEDWHAFKAKATGFLLWAQDTVVAMGADALASDVEGAETMLANHVTHKHNIDTFLQTTESVSEMHSALVADHNDLCAAQPHASLMEEVMAQQAEVLAVWENRRGQLDASSKGVT
jgi:hypothetical protein